MGSLVVVTGASRGLGLALARSVPFPAHVVDISRSGPPAASGIEHVPADLSDPAHLSAVVTRVREIIETRAPERCVFVHAAGTLSPIGFAGEVETDAYLRAVLLDSASGQVLGHGFLAAMRGRPGTHDLVMITSGAASKVYEGWSAYCAGKAALDRWVRVTGEEQRRRGGVRVSAISPGVLDTGMQEEIRGTSEHDFPAVERFRALHEEGELVDPEVAATRLWRLVESGIESGAVLDLRDA